MDRSPRRHDGVLGSPATLSADLSADREVPFPITNPAGDRLLTGADFDVESVQRVGTGRLDRRGVRIRSSSTSTARARC